MSDQQNEVYLYNRAFFEELRRSSYQAQIDYGKWLMASLLLVHGGSIVTIAQLGKDGMHIFAASGPWFVGGIILALLGGMCTWFNFSFGLVAYQVASNAIISQQDPYEAIKPYARRIDFTMYFAVGLGLLSAITFLVGACQIFSLLAIISNAAAK